MINCFTILPKFRTILIWSIRLFHSTEKAFCLNFKLTKHLMTNCSFMIQFLWIKALTLLSRMELRLGLSLKNAILKLQWMIKKRCVCLEPHLLFRRLLYLKIWLEWVFWMSFLLDYGLILKAIQALITHFSRLTISFTLSKEVMDTYFWLCIMEEISKSTILVLTSLQVINGCFW